MHLVAGTQLKNGQYLLNHVLDQQGIGWTYRATQTQLQQTVLVKTLNPTLRSHPQFAQICQDFTQRSRQLSRLRHPSIVRVLDIFTDQDMPFVILDYLQGISLNDWMNDRKRGEAEVIQLLRQMSHVLTYLQQHNLPHANLKPRNILYSSDAKNPEKNQLTLVGFAPSLRLSEMIAQRNPYSAPELRHGNVTNTSDLYSLAGLLYYCLTQHPPVETSIETERFPLLSLLKPGAQRLLQSASQLNSSDRPTSPELWLSQLSKSRPAAAKPVQAPAQTPVQTATSTQTAGETQIQVPHPPQPIDISQKPTYLQDPTSLREPARPSTQVQSPSTQVQSPSKRSEVSYPPTPAPIQPLTAKTAPTPNAPADPPPRYRTAPVTAFAKNSAERLPPAPARYIPDEPAVEHDHDRRPSARSADRTMSRSVSRSKYLPSPRVLKLTLLCAALSGLIFGIVLRIQASQRPGSSFFHTGQSFPPREWKGTLTPDAEVTKDVFIEPGSQRPEAAPAPSDPPANTPPANQPTKQFPVRSKSFDPDDVLIPETAPSPAESSSGANSQPEDAPIDASQPTTPNPIKPKKSP